MKRVMFFIFIISVTCISCRGSSAVEKRSPSAVEALQNIRYERVH